MSQIVKRTSEVTITNITNEARTILSNMERTMLKKPLLTERDQFVNDRISYWMSLGYSTETSKLKAEDDANWAL